MTYVITQGCCADAACIPVCPVQCIRPRPGDPDFSTAEQLYIDPATCIDCAACVTECPVDAISADYDLTPAMGEFLEINAAHFVDQPVIPEDPPPVEHRRLPAERPRLRVAVIGAGPAACYAIADLSAIRGVEVTVFDRLPTPFGLVRSGVAPDHPSTKLIGERFRSVLSRRNVTCLFNVDVGQDITVEEILRSHHAVIHAVGAASDRRLDVPGEDLPGSMSAREFVNWYNGHPDHASAEVDLSTDTAIVIGNGNVALDVARVLTAPIAEMERTDIADHGLMALRGSAVRHVVITARRGPEHAAFTSSEIAALSRIPDTDLLAEVPDPVDTAGASTTTHRKLSVVQEAAARTPTAGRRTITLRFGLQPIALVGDERISGVSFRRSDGTEELVDSALVIRAIGYRGTAQGGVPFDELTGTYRQSGGRIIDPMTAEPVGGQYCAGWIKRGPSGGIGTNRECSAETVRHLLDDFATGSLPDPDGSLEDLQGLLHGREVEMVDNAGWLRINQLERRLGQEQKRPRVKLVAVADLIAASQA